MESNTQSTGSTTLEEKSFASLMRQVPRRRSRVHREAHGLMPEKIIEVEPDVAEVFLGGTETSAAGAVLLPGGAPNERDPGIRTILFTDVVNSTTLTQLLGDEAALALLGVHDTI